MKKQIFERLFPFTAKLARRPRGVAIIMVLFFLMFMVFLATSVSYETIVEYNVSAQNVNRLKAYYAAKSGLEISLLRVLIYKKALASPIGKSLEGNKSLLDPIWNFPFAWPPSAFIPDSASLVDKSLIKDIEKSSTMDASYTTEISLEGSLIDINDLGSPSKGLQEATKQQLLNIFSRELESNEEFEERYGDFKFEKLVNHMIDWVDEDRESLNGGEERTYYYDFEEIDFSSFDNEFYPANEPFKTLDELHMVAMMEDELFDLIKGRITVFGTKGINVNHAHADVLLSIDREMTEEIVNEIIQRRDNKEIGGPFKDENEFINFITNVAGSNINPATFNEGGIPLLFDTVHNFRITSTGQFAQAIQEIVVITYDFKATKNRLITVLDQEDKKQDSDSQRDRDSAGRSTAPPSSKAPNPPATIPQGRPHIVYWNEK